MTEIILRKGEQIEKALRRLKKRLEREGTFEQVRRRRYFEKPSVKARRKLKAARFAAMLRERHAAE
jgi:small subunit ribosomal protein S21